MRLVDQQKITREDMLENSIPKNIVTKTDNFLHKLFTLVNEHRNSLDIPEGTNRFPYFLVTNDLWIKFVHALNLFRTNNIPLSKDQVLDLLEALLESFYENKSSHKHNGCCSLYFSCSEDEIQKLYDDVRAI